MSTTPKGRTEVPKPPTIADVMAKIAADLDWRGPTGKKAGHVVLTREQAVVLINTKDDEP